MASGTDVGRVRKRNEDTCAVRTSLGLAIVCDGIGGHSGGDVAAELATSAFCDAVARLEGEGLPLTDVMHASILAANQVVHGAAVSTQELADMGTTLVAALFDGPRVVIGHVGDSRAYLSRHDGSFERLTEDHSLLNQLIDAGVDVSRSPVKATLGSALTQSIGGALVHPAIRELTAAPGDVVLLCSDGLTDAADDLTIGGMTHAHRAGDRIADLPGALIALANQQGGKDNITVVSVIVSAKR